MQETIGNSNKALTAYTYFDAAKACSTEAKKVDPSFVRFLVRQYRVPVLAIGDKGRRVLPPSSIPILEKAIVDHQNIAFNDISLTA